MLYSIRSDRLLMEGMDYRMLFRWFIGLNLDDEVWEATVFTKNRNRLLEGDVARDFFGANAGASASQRPDLGRAFHGRRYAAGSLGRGEEFQPKDKKQPPPDDPGNPTVNFRGERRSNETHESKTDPQALLARKGEGKESKLSYCGNLLVENRSGLIVDAEVFQANGTAERRRQQQEAYPALQRSMRWRCSESQQRLGCLGPASLLPRLPDGRLPRQPDVVSSSPGPLEAEVSGCGSATLDPVAPDGAHSGECLPDPSRN